MQSSVANMWRKATNADSARPLVFEWRGAVKFLPLVLCGGFFGFSVLWLAIGPLDWHIANLPLLYAFLSACIVTLVVGYSFGIRFSKSKELTPVGPTVLDPNRILIIAGVVALVLYFPTVYETTGKWLPDVWGGLTNAGAEYRNTKRLNDSSFPLIFYVRFLLSPLLILMAPLTYFLWPRLSWLARVLGAASVLGTVALSISQGINKGMADLTAYTCLFLALLAASSLKKGRRRRLVGAIIAAAVVVTIFFSYYAINIQSRIAGDAERAAASAAESQDPSKNTPAGGVTNPNQGTDGTGSPNVSDGELAKAVAAQAALGGVATERKGHFIYALPNNLRASALILSGYMTHPYRGLSMALAESWTPTYGLGFSGFVRHNLAKVFGGQDFETAIAAQTYGGKISEKGWPVGKVWATFFIDPASDISFPGVILLMGAIGFSFGRAWRDTVIRGDPLAAGVFYSLCALVFYLPANNQLFQGGETAIGFTVIFALWIILRRGSFGQTISRLRSHLPGLRNSPNFLSNSRITK